MREIQVIEHTYTGKSASFNTDWTDASAGKTVEVFLVYTNITVGTTPSIAVKAQETPMIMSGEPEGTAVDVPTSKTVEGAYPSARSTNGIDTFTLEHIGGWVRIAFTLADITSVDINAILIIKD